MNKKLLFSIIKISGTVLMFFITLDMYVIVFHAWMYGHSVNVEFNAFAEAQVEYVLFALAFPVIIASLILRVRDFRRKRE